MKRLYLFLMALVMLSAAYGQQKAPSSFTLQQSIDFARENNPNLKSAKIATDAAKAKVNETVASGLPQITGSADLGSNVIIPTSFLPAEIVGGPAGEYVGVKFGTQYVGRALLNVDQMIFNGSYFVGLKASRTYQELSRKDLISTETDLVAAIKKAYYSVLVNRERLELLDKNYGRLDSLVNQTQAMFSSGFAEKIDINRAQVQLNNIITARNAGQIGVEVSTNLLKFQMGLPVSETIELSDNLETIRLMVLDDDMSKDFNYSNRIEYSKIETNMALTKLDIKNVQSQYLPSLSFYGNYGVSYGTSTLNDFVKIGSRWKDQAVIGIRANITLFDGLRKSSQIQQKKIAYQQLDNAKALTKNQIDMEQFQSNLTFKNNLATLKSQKLNMDLGEEVYKVTVIKYQQGVGSNIEVINADASFKEAQTNYYAALYDALIASVDLERAYGKILEQEK